MDWILRLFGYVSTYKINRVCDNEVTSSKELIDKIHSRGFEHLLSAPSSNNSDIKEFGSNLLQEKQKIENKVTLILDLKKRLL